MSEEVPVRYKHIKGRDGKTLKIVLPGLPILTRDIYQHIARYITDKLTWNSFRLSSRTTYRVCVLLEIVSPVPTGNFFADVTKKIHSEWFGKRYLIRHKVLPKLGYTGAVADRIIARMYPKRKYLPKPFMPAKQYHPQPPQLLHKTHNQPKKPKRQQTHKTNFNSGR